ncbi:MAG: NHLP family bacteriocin export ABC transporter peptidase/permease/ATPase subunit [Clostridiales bacterium]|nr:NHLP family bacteriocin export ABC transporter peptidase/permease/ATPase subunit [Clostridiales bacterium]
MERYAKTPTVFQMEMTECGAASLSMIFGYYGKFLPLEQMRIETGVSRDGCNAKNILAAARKYGLTAKGYRKKVTSLPEVKVPAIIFWNNYHFVVFEGFKHGFAYINDPAVGRRKLTQKELQDGFSGVVLTFELTENFEKQKKKNTTFAFIKERIANEKETLGVLIAIGLLLVFPQLVLPVLSQVFMDDILLRGYTDWLPKLLLFMGLLLALKAALTFWRGLILGKLKAKLTLISGHSLFMHMLRLPISFFDQRHAGSLVSRMESNTKLNDFLSGDLAETVLNLFSAVFYLIILFIYSPSMTLIGLFLTGIMMALLIYSGKVLAGQMAKLTMNSSKLFSALVAGLSITDTLKASGAESEYSLRVLGHQAKQARLEQELSRNQQILGAIPEALANLSDVIMLMIGGILVIRGQLTMGMLIAFSSLFDSFMAPVNALVRFSEKLQGLRADLERIEDIERYPEDERYHKEEKSSAAARKLSGKVELSDISFGYSPLKAPLVENLSFRLESGSSIAFVGSSGCGKSTAAKLVSGLYTPWTGNIRFDGKEKNEIPREVLNASIATVSQNINLFSGSIRDNITLWNPAILEEDMIAAAKDACIHDFIISQPGAYDYPLAEGAENLSGGQRQRIEIARALATKPTILIMDEATSALDPITEKEILDNIKRRGCTCIIVAHRLSAIRDAEQIIVLQNGKVIQKGDHNTLSACEGFYRDRLIMA